MRCRSLASSGYPLTISDVAQQVVAIATQSHYQQKICEKLREQYDFHESYFFSSGRAALYILLRALAQIYPHRREVVIPAYACYSVPAAVVKAGLQVCPCDIDPCSLDFDWRQLESICGEGTLCVLSSSLFGLRVDSARAAGIAKKSGAFMIADIAQSFGSIDACNSADAAIMSFNRGKNVTSLEGGGVMVFSSLLIEPIEKQLREIEEFSLIDKGRLVAKTAVATIFLYPLLYPLVKSLPFLHIGRTIYSTNFTVKQFSNVQQVLLLRALHRFPRVCEIRRKHTRFYSEYLQRNTQIQIPTSLDLHSPLRFPILVPEHRREAIYQQLQDYGVSKTYPRCVAAIEELPPSNLVVKGDFPNACEIVQQILTLPIHHFVTDADRNYIAEKICAIVSYK